MAKILVVEDNPENMELTVLMLEQAGHTTILANNAEQGLSSAMSEQPELILMDISLPGMDGLEATRILKSDEKTCEIPIIALTALAMKGDEERIKAAGCDAYISKPLYYKNLWSIIETQLDKSK